MGRPRKGAFDEATVERVLRAAERTFGERGYRDARLEDIAAEAGIRRPSLLYHFGSKANLYREVVHRAFEEIRGTVSATLARGDDYETTVVATTRALVELEQRHRALLGVALRTLLDPRDETHDVVTAEFVPIIDMLVTYVESRGRARPNGVDARAAISHLIFGHLARAALGGDPQLWGRDRDTEAITRALLLP